MGVGWSPGFHMLQDNHSFSLSPCRPLFLRLHCPIISHSCPNFQLHHPICCSPLSTVLTVLADLYKYRFWRQNMIALSFLSNLGIWFRSSKGLGWGETASWKFGSSIYSKSDSCLYPGFSAKLGYEQVQIPGAENREKFFLGKSWPFFSPEIPQKKGLAYVHKYEWLEKRGSLSSGPKR